MFGNNNAFNSCSYHYVNFLFSDIYFSLLSSLPYLPPPPSSFPSLLYSLRLPLITLPPSPSPPLSSSPFPPLPLPSSSHLPLPRFTQQVLQSVGNLQLEMDAKEACMKPMSEILPMSVVRLKTFVQEILQIDQKTGEL